MSLNITCPRCQSAFVVADVLAAVPVLELADQDQPERFVERMENKPSGEPEGAPLERGIELVDADAFERSPQQRIVAALLVRSLADCKPGVIDHIAAVITNVLLLPFSVGVGFLVVLVMYYPLAWGNRLFGGGNGGLLYLLPVGLLLIVSGFKKLGQAETIEAERKGSEITRLKLGRLHDTFTGGAGVTLLLVGLLLGWQAGLFYYVPNACGLSSELTAGQAWVLALDTVSLNNLSSVLGAFGMEVPWRDSAVWSDTVFQIFRTAYEALAALFVYQLYQRWKWRHLLDGLPELFAGADAFAYWADKLCRNDRAWPRRLFDEFLFLSIASLYVRGRWDEARGLARRFPWIRVAPEVRRLFLDSTGDTLFPPG